MAGLLLLCGQTEKIWFTTNTDVVAGQLGDIMHSWMKVDRTFFLKETIYFDTFAFTLQNIQLWPESHKIIGKIVA